MFARGRCSTQGSPRGGFGGRSLLVLVGQGPVSLLNPAKDFGWCRFLLERKFPCSDLAVSTCEQILVQLQVSAGETPYRVRSVSVKLHLGHPNHGTGCKIELYVHVVGFLHGISFFLFFFFFCVA